jgi:hypothetical protein
VLTFFKPTITEFDCQNELRRGHWFSTEFILFQDLDLSEAIRIAKDTPRSSEEFNSSSDNSQSNQCKSKRSACIYRWESRSILNTTPALDTGIII